MEAVLAQKPGQPLFLGGPSGRFRLPAVIAGASRAVFPACGTSAAPCRFPRKNTQYFRKNNPYFRKNCQYFRKFCQYFCLFPDGRRWPHGRREKRHPAVSQPSEPLPAVHGGFVRALPAGGCSGCTADVGREGPGRSLFEILYMFIPVFIHFLPFPVFIILWKKNMSYPSKQNSL